MNASVQQICEHLHKEASDTSEGQLWLGIDAGSPNAPPLPALLQQAIETPATLPVRPRHPSMEGHPCPHWLPLNLLRSQGSQLLALSVEHALAECAAPSLRQGQGRRISGWLLCGHDAEQAAQHLALSMVRKHPDGTACLLRLHDPAVMWAIWQVLDSTQRVQLLGPIQTWCLLDPRQRLTVLSETARDEKASLATWSEAQWQDIAHIGAFNKALRQQPPRSGKLDQCLQVALQAMRRARAAGFRHPQDLVAYATHAMNTHPRFDMHPLVRQALDLAQPDQSFCERVSGLSDEDWALVHRSTI